jgi:hypothetical protein
MRRTRTKADLKATAYHEAGHAVIGRVLGVSDGRVTIRPDYNTGSAGREFGATPSEICAKYPERDHNAVIRAWIISVMAGAETEAALLGRVALGDGGDRKQIGLMMEENISDADWDRVEARLRRMTRTLIWEHEALIERVAKALLARTSLSGKMVDKLVGFGPIESRLKQLESFDAEPPVLLHSKSRNN